MRRQRSPEHGRAWRGNALSVLGALLAGAAFLTVQDLAQDLRVSNKARDALARQVQQMGGTPVAGEPGSRGEVGPSGAPGRDGADGQDAPTITPSPGASGAAGRPGKPGADSSVPGPTGAAGQPGADSTVPGPAGPQGPAGPPGPEGPAGPQGEQGPAGEPGADGSDGQACPTGYSWQAPAGDPDALICRRDGAPDPKPGKPGLLSLALDPTRRQYP